MRAFAVSVGHNLRTAGTQPAASVPSPSPEEASSPPIPDLLPLDPLVPPDPIVAPPPPLPVPTPIALELDPEPLPAVTPMPVPSQAAVSPDAIAPPVPGQGSSTTQLQQQTARLLHLQTSASIELPQSLTVIHIGKPNDRIPPDIDVSGFPDSEIVSRIHADIRLEGDAYYLEDVGSSNGTYINTSPCRWAIDIVCDRAIASLLVRATK